MLYICFAAFNEEPNISPLLRRIAEEIGKIGPYKIIAYDDGSTDGTHKSLLEHQSKYPLEIIHAPVNQGLGAGLNRLIEYLSGTPDDDSSIAVFVDGDDTHDPATIPIMVKAIENGSDVAIASRFVSGNHVSGIPLSRKLLSIGASLFWRILMPTQDIKDYTSGFRAYRISKIKLALAESSPLITRTGFECQIELLSRLRPYSSFKEVPINLQYERKQGQSKMRVMRTVVRNISLGLYFLLLKKS